MASNYYKLSGGTANRHTDWTTEVVLKRDEDGNVTKSVSVNEPVELNSNDRETLKALGYEVESSTKAEAQAAEATPTDVAGAAPTFGSPDSVLDQGTKESKSK